MMDPLHSKAQRQINSTASKAASRGSARKARKKKRGSSNKAGGRQQNAGQPSGPGGSVSTSQRSRSRSAVHAEEEAPSRTGGMAMGAKCASYTVGALHALDIGLGLALIVYGAMVHVTSVTAAAVAYGLVLLLGGIAGAIGYYSGACNRRGLRASSVFGAITMLLDIGAFIAVIGSWDSFIQFLTDNAEALMLNEASVSTIQGLKILFAVIFIVLAGLEGHRCLVMWGMKDTMQDQTSSRRSLSSRSSGSNSGVWNKFLSLFGLGKRKKTDDFVVFDDNASMESSLLWSKNDAQPTSDDYLEFVPEHERGLANFTSSVALPQPPEDRVDY